MNACNSAAIALTKTTLSTLKTGRPSQRTPSRCRSSTGVPHDSYAIPREEDAEGTPEGQDQWGSLLYESCPAHTHFKKEIRREKRKAKSKKQKRKKKELEKKNKSLGAKVKAQGGTSKSKFRWQKQASRQPHRRAQSRHEISWRKERLPIF
jgi:hypothetical protein